MTDLTTAFASPPAGSRPSLIRAFGIRGLHGYRNISLSSDHAATILIAKNGTGKTTLLGALSAFLKLQFHRLRELSFSEIYCHIENYDQELVLTSNDIDTFLTTPEDGELIKVSRKINIPPGDIIRFLTEDWPLSRENRGRYPDYPVYYALVQSEGHSLGRADRACETMVQEMYSHSPNIARIAAILTEALGGYEIVYLPTYRRVELTLRGDAREPSGRRRRPRFEVASGSLFTGDIQFGLSDISDRLEEMNSRIVADSNNGYRRISASIINELLDGTFGSHSDVVDDIPSRDDLHLFFSRLEDRRSAGSPYFPVSSPNLDKIYSLDGIPPDSARFLRYFLSQLDKVIVETRETERSVEGFVAMCNKYLASEDPSTRLSSEYSYSSVVDGKQLVLNRRNLRVHVESLPERRKITLDALSSGEKQMISLFAKLFLYDRPKIVLIDEPELSLSLDWQRSILVDVMSSPLCRQIIAITHSPFVFDNELEPYARPLNISRLTVAPQESEGDDVDE